MNRRTLLKNAALVAVSSVASATVRAIGSTHVSSTPVIDSHIHLFNPLRPGGVPWPEPDDVIYKPSLPDRYQKLAHPFGIVGAIAIEASPLASDNNWVLKIVDKYPIMVGMVGNLAPGTSTYTQQLEALHTNPYFLGIRYGNLWGRNLALDWKTPSFLEHLKLLAQMGHIFETANPNTELLEAVLDIAARLPELTIMIDHLPNAEIPTEPQEYKTLLARIEELGHVPHVYTKLSEVLQMNDGSRLLSKEAYQERLDPLWEVFGPDRVLYGSDWPNSDHIAPYAQTFQVIHDYMSTKDEADRKKFFFRNSQKAYRWHPRLPQQNFNKQS